MSSAGALRLHLGVRFTTGYEGRTGNRVEGLLKEIERLESQHPIPLYWNFPVAPVLEKHSRATADLVTALRRRIGSGQDRIIPSGFTAAAHPLLLPEELERELRWCYHNPWFPSLRRLFGARPEIILPVYPDLYGEALDKAYSRQGFRTIGIPIPLYRLDPCPGKSRWTELRPLANPEYSIRGTSSEVRLRPIVVLHPQQVNTKQIDALLSTRAPSLTLMLDLCGDTHEGDSTEPAAAPHLFKLLSRHRQVEFHPFPADALESTPPAVDPGELLKFVAPVDGGGKNRIWDGIEKSRQKKRKHNLQMRQLLNTIADAGASGSATRFGQAESEETDTIEVTNISMGGSVSLAGIGVQAKFGQGRLSNLIDHGEEVLPGEAGRSFLSLGGKRELLQTESAFSFNRGEQTGLRSILCTRADGRARGVQFILDYYFCNERSSLSLDITARYPALAHGIVTEAAALELCLCSFTGDDRPNLTVNKPKGDAYTEVLAPDTRVLVAWGKRFRLQQGKRSVELQPAPEQATRTGKIEFRIEKKRLAPRGSAYLLWANLGGSYLPQPAAGLSSHSLQLSYRLDFSAAGRGKRS